MQIQVLFITMAFTSVPEKQTINWFLNDNLNKTHRFQLIFPSEHRPETAAAEEVVSSKTALQPWTMFELASVLKQEAKIPHRAEVCALAEYDML